MDAEMLTQVIKVTIGTVLSLALGRMIMGSVLKVYGALMDAIPPGAWLVIIVVVLIGVAAIVGFLFGTTLP